MFLSAVLLARTREDRFIVGSTTSRVQVGGIKNIKALFGMDEEEKHS